MSNEKGRIEENKLSVTKIKDGIVIDHIPAGLGYYVLKIIGISEYFKDKMVSAVINANSERTKLKDVVKIQGELDKVQIEKLGLIIHGSTINVIKDYKVIDKHLIEAPKQVQDLITCPETKCITNSLPKEPISRDFTTIKTNPVTLRCEYCDRIFEIDLEAIKL